MRLSIAVVPLPMRRAIFAKAAASRKLDRPALAHVLIFVGFGGAAALEEA